VFGFDEAREAYAYLETARHFGKVVIKIERLLQMKSQDANRAVSQEMA
jgi:hypothetical protein